MLGLIDYKSYIVLENFTNNGRIRMKTKSAWE